MRILIVPGFNGSGPGHWRLFGRKNTAVSGSIKEIGEIPDIVEWIKTIGCVYYGEF